MSIISSLKPLLKQIIPLTLIPTLLQLFYFLRAPFYRGNVVYCPCCESDLSQFLDFSSYGHIRKKVQCPKCGALERHRLMWLYLQSKTDLLNTDTRLLHFAPELILQKKFKSTSNIDYTSADLFHPNAMVKMDIQDIPYKDNCIDAILCLHVLNHVEDDAMAINELHRVLQPGGWAIIQVGIDNGREHTFEDANAKTPVERKEVFGQADLVRIYGVDFSERLKSAGFEVEEVQYARELSDELIDNYGLVKTEKFFRCTKPSIAQADEMAQ